MRTYLNGDFYNSFSADDKAKIASTQNSNPNNSDYGTSGGNDTSDYVYLLSIDEATSLDDTIRNCGVNWWLRSPGTIDFIAAFVDFECNIDTEGADVDNPLGVRPALNLEF